MSSLWKVQQARYMLARSRDHQHYFPGDAGDHRRAYEFYVDATLHALYGIKDYLRKEFAGAESASGDKFEDWYKQRVTAHLERQDSLLAFLFKRGEGVRNITTHQEPLLLSASGGDAVEPDESLVTRMDYYFQDLQFATMREAAPKWKKELAGQSVDEIVGAALEQLVACVREAFILFEGNLAVRELALKRIEER